MNLEIVEGRVFDVIGAQDAVIAQMDAQYLTLKINGVTDKKGFEAVHAARMIYKKIRVEVERKGLELRKKAKATIEDYLVAEKTEEARILKLLEPGETILSAEEKAYTDALEAIKAVEERKEAERIQARRDRLSALGVMFNGQVWAAGEKTLPDVVVRILSDPEFEAQATAFDLIFTEAKRISDEAESKRKEEAALLEKARADLEAERLRIEAVASAQREKEAGLLAEAARIEKEKQAAADAEKKRLAEIERQKQKVIDDEARAVELEQAKQAAALEAVKDMEEKQARDLAEKTAKDEAARIAAEKKAAKLPDKTKLSQMLDEIFRITTPDIKTPEARSAYTVICTKIEAAEKVCREIVEAL